MSFSTDTNVPKKRKQDLRMVEDDTSGAQHLQTCLRSIQGGGVDASRPSPSLGPRTREHTKLIARHAKVTLPSLDLPPRKRLPETLKDTTLCFEQMDFVILEVRRMLQ